MRAGTIGLSLGFQPQDTLTIGPRPHKAHQNRPRARARPRKWGWVGELLEYCAKSELHPPSGLAVLKGRQKLIEDLVGIQGGKCLSTATFRAGAFFIRTRG
jgi:hypothetical protein